VSDLDPEFVQAVRDVLDDGRSQGGRRRRRHLGLDEVVAWRRRLGDAAVDDVVGVLVVVPRESDFAAAYVGRASLIERDLRREP